MHSSEPEHCPPDSGPPGVRSSGADGHRPGGHRADGHPVDIAITGHSLLGGPGTAPAAPRADAAHNRRKILDAAARIMADEGPEALTMNALARASGVGVGTVYRRFGDVAQLFAALLDERERRFQTAFMAGPPPLGPGAPPGERLRAFLHAMVDRVVEQRELLLAGESASPVGHYDHDAHLARHTHVTMLVRLLRPSADAALTAHLLLAPTAAGLITHLTRDRGRSPQQIKDGLDTLLDGVLSG